MSQTLGEQYYRIGTPGQPWGPAEKAQWLAQTQKQRSYHENVATTIDTLRDKYDISQYGVVTYNTDSEPWPLFAIQSKDWDAAKPCVLVTGGVHGYETSGVHGALLFASGEDMMGKFVSKFNIVVCPCISPWCYERIQRMNANTIDPNREFKTADKDSSGDSGELGECPEATLLKRFITSLNVPQWMAHFDLHETTDTDSTEFMPAKHALVGEYMPGEGFYRIPDGFYCVLDSLDRDVEFGAAVVAGAKKWTHIAPTDENGVLTHGLKILSEGVIEIPMSQIGICSGFTNARYKTTTEIYPDSPAEDCTPERCNHAQASAVCCGLDFILGKL